MTTQEVLKAKSAYHAAKQGKDFLMNLLGSANIKQFTTNNMPLFNSASVASITYDMILRNAFLREASKTEFSNNLMVYLNDIERMSASINDGQSVLSSVDWNKEKITPTSEDLKIFKLYCDLETNRPVLIGEDNLDEFRETSHVIELPGYTPIREEYQYNSTSLEKIYKGSASIMYERLQLYYFRQLLVYKQEHVVEKILKKETLEGICL